MGQIRNGSVVMTKLLEHMCRILAKFGAALNAFLAGAVSSGAITPAEAAVATAFLASINAACAVFKKATGY